MLASACVIGSRRSGRARSTCCCSRLTAPASARCAASDAVAASTMVRASASSESVMRLSLMSVEMDSATRSVFASATNAPPMAPTFTRMRPRASRTRSASRTVMRETPNCSASSRSDCSRSPAWSSALNTARSICETISPLARDCRTGVNTARILTLSALFPGLRPLRHRDFALYFSGLTVSQCGDWIEATTTSWLLYQITGDPVLLGLGGGIRAASIILFGLIGGALADRTDRRRLLFFTQTGFALASLALGLLVLSARVSFWHIYVFSAVNGALGSFDAPARRSLFPSLVPLAEMQNAVVLNAAVFRLARLIGPAIGGVIIAVYGPAVSYFVNFASYAAILVALAAMRVPPFVAKQRSRALLQDVADGLRYTLRRPLLRAVLVLESTHSFFGVNTALITIIATDVLRAGPEGLGLLLSAQALGALIGTTALLVSGDMQHKGRAMVVAGAAYCVALALLAAATRFEVAALLLIATAITDAYWTAMRNTMFQLQTDEAYRGRSLSTVLLAGRGFTQGAQLETGIAVSIGGPAFAVVSGAAVIAAVLTVVNLRTAEVRRLRGLPDAVAAATATIPGDP